MFIYIPNFDKFNAKIATLTSMQVQSETNNETPAVTLIVRKSKIGGVDNPTQYIVNPANTLVFCGNENDKGFTFAEQAILAGVPEENILFVPQGQNMSIKTLAERLIGLASQAQPQDQENDFFNFEDDVEGPITSPSAPNNRTKIIAVIGFRGGVGQTTIATSLATHFADIGDKVAILDLGSPALAKKHFGVELMEDKEGISTISTICDIYNPSTFVWEFPVEKLNTLVTELRAKYRRVIVDFPKEFHESFLNAVAPDKLITVMDPDVVQTVEPASSLNGQSVFVYNKAIPDIDSDIVADYVGATPIIIPHDFEGCQAALAGGEPAYRKSSAMAQGIGELAAVLD